jgi:hypothetical protein
VIDAPTHHGAFVHSDGNRDRAIGIVSGAIERSS